YPADRPDLLEAYVLDALRAAGSPETGHQGVAQYVMEDRIGLVTQPALVIRATADPYAAPEAATLCARLPQARCVDIDGGMVPLPDQLPEAFAAAVLAFLDQLPGAAARRAVPTL
ncbi:MAG: alpha/beta hydrolase, partial [Lautropia sp.]